jgi:pimeloyl-ACP methyl ester carboxylesterase
MKPLRRNYIDSRWGQLHYRDNEDDGPLTIVSFHESPLNGEVFEGLGRALRGNGRFVALDTPGYGNSDGPDAMVTIEEYAEVMWDAISPHLPNSNLWLLGSHTGALIAIEVARRWGTAISGLALSGTPVFRPERRWRYAGSHTPDLTPQHDGGHLITAWERYQKKAAEGSSPTSLRFMTYASCAIAANHDRYDRAYQAAFRYDTLRAFKEVNCPIVLLTAEKDSCAAYDADLIGAKPDIIAQQIPSISGRPYWVAPDLFASDLLALLDDDRNQH